MLGSRTLISPSVSDTRSRNCCHPCMTSGDLLVAVIIVFRANSRFDCYSHSADVEFVELHDRALLAPVIPRRPRRARTLRCAGRLAIASARSPLRGLRSRAAGEARRTAPGAGMDRRGSACPMASRTTSRASAGRYRSRAEPTNEKYGSSAHAPSVRRS